MEKIRPRFSKILKIVLVLIILLSIFSYCFRSKFGRISEYISELGIVYTPSTVPDRFYNDELSIDTFEYWVFKLNDSEKEEISRDIKTGNWEKLNSNHIERLESFSYYKILGFLYKKHDCYICIYDCNNNVNITNSKNLIYLDTSSWIIFLYDTVSGKYYCIHQAA